MKLKAAAKSIIFTACWVYTAFTVLFNLILLASQRSELALDPSRSMWILLFSAIIGIAGWIRRCNTLSAWVRYPIHASIIAGAFYLCLMLPSQAELHASSVLLLLVLYIILYTLIVGICILLSGKHKKKQENCLTYTPQYQKSEDSRIDRK